FYFFFQAEDGIRDFHVTGVQTCALPIYVLNIYNGKNQSKVVNPNGRYPIYGSGGLMGYSDDFLCPAETTIIGRKGSINNPIFVNTEFWNVDTAFGLVAKEGLLPKYLYYFCKTCNFLKLDKSTTLRSLTKSDRS